MQITRPTPATLEVRVAPWSIWIIGVVIAAIGAALLLLMQLGWVTDLRCRHVTEGEARCTLTRSLYGMLPRVTEVRGVTGARVDVSHGSRSTSYRTVLISVAGHTDNTGDPLENQRLSAERAAAVKQALVGQGVPAARVTDEGYGADRPIASNDTEVGRARNRRVELIVLKR